MPTFTIRSDRKEPIDYDLCGFINEFQSWYESIPENRIQDFLEAVMPFIPSKMWGKSNTLLVQADSNSGAELIFTLTRIPDAVKMDAKKKR